MPTIIGRSIGSATLSITSTTATNVTTSVPVTVTPPPNFFPTFKGSTINGITITPTDGDPVTYHLKGTSTAWVAFIRTVTLEEGEYTLKDTAGTDGWRLGVTVESKTTNELVTTTDPKKLTATLSAGDYSCTIFVGYYSNSTPPGITIDTDITPTLYKTA